MEGTRKHQNLTRTSNIAVFRSSVKNHEPAKGASTPPWSAKKSWAKSSGWRNKPGNTDSKLNDSEIPADVSVKQPNKELAGCWMKSDGNAHRHENEKTTTTQPATKVLKQPYHSFSETKSARTSKAWTQDPCSQNLTSGLNMRVFPFFVGRNVWQQGKNRY